MRFRVIEEYIIEAISVADAGRKLANYQSDISYQRVQEWLKRDGKPMEVNLINLGVTEIK